MLKSLLRGELAEMGPLRGGHAGPVAHGPRRHAADAAGGAAINLVGTYTDRLMRNFAVSSDFRRDLARATGPVTIISGADDELMFADKYAEAVRAAKTPIDVKLIEGVNHMGIVSVPKAISAIADDVATRGTAGT
jgi:pimeloyl-ACP methyl ester carboxylesterase